MLRTDCSHDYWKERFISGLPKLFAEKVRTNIRRCHNGDTPYGIMSYGDLISYVNLTGLELCNSIKLNNQIQKYSTKGELGSFCEDANREIPVVTL